LGFRLLAPLLVTVGAVLAVYAIISFGSIEDDYLRMLRADVERSSRLINRATHDGMLLNRKEEVQATIERLAEAPEIAAIRIYDNMGTIAMSAHKEEIGRPIPLDSETCRSCHQDGRTRDAAVLEHASPARVDVGTDVVRHLSVIENEPACATALCHAHPADQRVLGVLDLEMSMAPLEAAVGTARRQFLWTTVILIVIVGAVVAVFFRYLVQRPVRQLYQGTLRIAEGDLDTRIEVRGRHELARLAEAFNRMAGDLSAARQEVTQWSQKLEEKVIQKTEELRRAERQVLHMEKMASLGQLSATVAHEINNPISGMLTYARLVKRELEEQPMDAGVREELTRHLTLIEMECSRCGAIVQNLLLFSRRTGAAMAPVDLNEIVERSLMLVRHHLQLKGVKLNSELLSGNREIVADAGQLQQALVALLVNAVEAMSGLKEGEGELTVRLSGSDDEVRIDIGDTGVGIPTEVLPKIFEPFFSTKEAEKGVGLGLSVVYGIVRRHGGQIEVESKVGRGTVFHLRLPRQTGDRNSERR
jgi:two-component system NtrC family sensor kinase